MVDVVDVVTLGVVDVVVDVVTPGGVVDVDVVDVVTFGVVDVDVVTFGVVTSGGQHSHGSHPFSLDGGSHRGASSHT